MASLPKLFWRSRSLNQAARSGCFEERFTFRCPPIRRPDDGWERRFLKPLVLLGLVGAMRICSTGCSTVIFSDHSITVGIAMHISRKQFTKELYRVWDKLHPDQRHDDGMIPRIADREWEKYYYGQDLRSSSSSASLLNSSGNVFGQTLLGASPPSVEDSGANTSSSSIN